jgi:hypothetical protein
MTAAEMQYNFELKRNTLYSLDKPYTSYDINFLLNKAQDDIVDERYSKDTGDEKTFFEGNERLRMELGGLITDYNQTGGQFNTTDGALHSNGSFVTMPTDLLYSLKEDCLISYSDCNGDVKTKTIKVIPVTHDEYLMNINNAYKKPYEDLVWRLDYKGSATGTVRHELIDDGVITITNYHMRYLKRPGRINILTGVDCQLNTILHEEIVDRAVTYADIFLKRNTIVEPTTQKS